MATDEASGQYLAAFEGAEAEGLTELSQGDWGRLSRDAFLSNRIPGGARMVLSAGTLRLSGPSVVANTADLSAVGALATAWQRAVSATGAALEQFRSLRGALPSAVQYRTALVLSAAPEPGSVLLRVEPKANPLEEAESSENVAIVAPNRPLADRAAEQLIGVLGKAANVHLTEQDAIAGELSELGPRAGSALGVLARVLDRENLTLDATWAEPQTATRRATVTPSTARWIADFVSGRGLDSEEDTIDGVLRTVSDRERWLVEVDGEDIRMDASHVSASAEGRSVGERVTLRVLVAPTLRPDGSTPKKYTILEVIAAEPI